jgi:hypothetical protein
MERRPRGGVRQRLTHGQEGSKQRAINLEGHDIQNEIRFGGLDAWLSGDPGKEVPKQSTLLGQTRDGTGRGT